MTVYLDGTAAPIAPTLLEPADGSASMTNLPLITGTAAPGAIVKVFVDGVLVATVLANASGSWSYQLAPDQALPDGAHGAFATATDPAGNTASTATHSFTIEGIVPDTTITDGPASGKSTDGHFAFTASVTGATFECSLDNEPFSPCATPLDLAGVSVGPHNKKESCSANPL